MLHKTTSRIYFLYGEGSDPIIYIAYRDKKIGNFRKNKKKKIKKRKAHGANERLLRSCKSVFPCLNCANST